MSNLCFARKRHPSEGSSKRLKPSERSPSSLSAGNSPLHANSRLSVYTPKTSYRSISVADLAGSEDSQDGDFTCLICKKPYFVPRLLTCLHSFCTKCLQNLDLQLANTDDENAGLLWAPSPHPEPSDSRPASARSSLHPNGLSPRPASKLSWNDNTRYFDGDNGKTGIYDRKLSGKYAHYLICPTCGEETPLPIGGVSALPVNRLLQQKMITATLEVTNTKLLCDNCITDNPAENRCISCSLNVCLDCGKRGHKTPGHVLVPLPARRPRSCDEHPSYKLELYCETCCELLCKNCFLLSHEGHTAQAASLAAEQRANALRIATARASYTPDNVSKSLGILDHYGKELNMSARNVEDEVRIFAWQYTRAVAEHARALEAAAASVRHRYQEKMEERAEELKKKSSAAKEAVFFARELLQDATDEELLALSNNVLKRLEWCTRIPDARPTIGRVALLKDANPDPTTGIALAGRVVTANVDPKACQIDIKELRNMRVFRRQEIKLQLVDEDGEPMCFGGEKVISFYRYKQSISRPTPVEVRDNKDGTYQLMFTPDRSGIIQLAVLVNDKPLKGSPFEGAAVLVKPHTGKFHCCSYCSSRGNKEALCGCKSSMGGGYKGCGHGHSGHPGARHWSCCGSTDQHSECAKANLF